MILVDTNIIIDFWRDTGEVNSEIFSKHEIAICPVIRIELLYGAKSEKEREKIKEALNELHMLHVDKETWEIVEEILFKSKRKGITLPFQDAIIAAAAIKNNCELWTRDNHFSMIAGVISKLEFFKKID
jgi:predicted nucleic acid-binding protein